MAVSLIKKDKKLSFSSNNLSMLLYSERLFAVSALASKSDNILDVKTDPIVIVAMHNAKSNTENIKDRIIGFLLS